MVSRETAGAVPLRPDLPAWLEPAAADLSAFVDLLASEGVTRGLIGPREVPRLWDRHVLNCAVVADPEVGLVPGDARIADVGSGAGLPGLAWAIVRPDLHVTLIEPLLRRAAFLQEAVASLGLAERVAVWRGRAEDAPTELRGQQVVTARAVAPLTRLVGWLAPLVAPSGRLVALKGSSAAAEVQEAGTELARAGLVDVQIRQVGMGVVEPPTTVVVATRRAAQ